MSKTKKTRNKGAKKRKKRPAVAYIQDGTDEGASERASPFEARVGTARDRDDTVDKNGDAVRVNNNVDIADVAAPALPSSLPLSASADLSLLNSTSYALSNTILSTGQALSLAILGSVSTTNQDQQMMRATTQRTVSAILGDPSPTSSQQVTVTPEPDCSCRRG